MIQPKNHFKPSHNASSKPGENNDRNTVVRDGNVINAAERHDDGLRNVQRIRKRTLRIGGLMMLLLVTLAQASWQRKTNIHDVIEATGIIAIMICIVGRGWCALYIGGRKKTELVMTGPYSLCRNPLYLFSIIGAFGAGAESGSIVIAGLFAIVCWIVLREVTLREEAVLKQSFGPRYYRYLITVPRFRPATFRWRDESPLICQPPVFLRTIRDGCWFLIAGPLLEGVKVMQEQGWITPLVYLP
ncbi:isoprenylcysteine carboxylmethyltransferase family protein [Thalassospira sp. A3_1]|uniref:methyltransferase family protein n=1 Tax=Thalassospira sp. A3_1 TaxID=2821088 RepID=UPI001ADA8475|nr:isoprenylcysteine carboxylmethyltransferase family protein [Thalassospira sp. A3_1]MBO9507888.1 isoprenylcysteine carboxylmethyltransferase family protein [Thalassospira sp. A3_1]